MYTNMLKVKYINLSHYLNKNHKIEIGFNENNN